MLINLDMTRGVPKPILRGGTYHLRARVPRRYARVEHRKEVWLSLHTDSFEEARRRASAAWEEQIEGWEARLKGDTADAEARFEAARELSRRRGFRYLPAEQVAKLPLADLLQRVEASTDRRGRPIPSEADALLGTVPKPEITVSRALDLFWELLHEFWHTSTLRAKPAPYRRARGASSTRRATGGGCAAARNATERTIALTPAPRFASIGQTPVTRARAARWGRAGRRGWTLHDTR